MTAHFTRISQTLFLTGLLVTISASCVQAHVPEIAPERLKIGEGRHALLLPYRASHDLNQRHDELRRLIIMVHGTLRNADVYHLLTMDAVRASGEEHETLVITPQFLMARDLDAHRPEGSVLYWTNAGWKQGDESRSTRAHPRPRRISSYEAMERLLHHVVSNGTAPNLHEIVIAGHSAGGQYVNRFAAGSRYINELAESDINVRFIVSNPSSYVYFCDARWCDNEEHFTIYGPDRDDAGCTTFSGYKYGMERLNRFMRGPGRNGLLETYPTRHVTYLLGERDNDPEARFLDTRCPAMLQGAHRLERGKRYHQYLGWRFGEAVYETHTKHIVPGVGHNARGIFTSAAGRDALFGERKIDEQATVRTSDRQASAE